jgi:hypothetical protein
MDSNQPTGNNMDKSRIFQIAIVAPVHIQPSKEWIESLQSVTRGKKNVRVIIVDDSNGKVELPGDWTVYDYLAQEELLGPEMYKRFEVFHKSSACKSIGSFIAWKTGMDIVIGLDSDCIVPPNFISSHLEAMLSTAGGWTNPIAKTGWYARGYPYAERHRQVIGNLGLWEHELDIYGKDRVEMGTPPSSPMVTVSHLVADGFLPFSGMNWAIWAWAVPAFLFLPNFEYLHGDDKNYRFRRHDDIWGGYIFQSCMNLLGCRLAYGDPVVYHDTIVDAVKDAEEEEAMVEFESFFYNAVDSAFAKIVAMDTYEDTFKAFAKIVEVDWIGTEFEPLIEPIRFWSELFSNSHIDDAIDGDPDSL